MNKKSGALFSVFCDDENVNTRQRQQGTTNNPTSTSSGSSSKKSLSLRQSSSSSLPSAALSAKDNRSRGPALANKENAKAGSSSSLSGKKVFGGIEPFSHAFSVASGSLEEKQQALGYFGPPGGKPSSRQSSSAGFKGLSTDDMSKLSLHSSGDPVKKPSSSSSSSLISGNNSSGCGRGLGESRLQQRASKAIQLQGVCHLQHGEAGPPGTPSGDSVLAQARQSSSALANISEAFSGQGGFHYSPSGATFEGTMDTPRGPIHVLPDAHDPAYPDDPNDETVVFNGSPIKRRARPFAEKKAVRALRI